MKCLMQLRKTALTNIVRMTRLTVVVGIFILLHFSASSTFAQEKEKIIISGDKNQSKILTITEIKKMAHVEVLRKDRDRQDHKYSGVLLSELLSRSDLAFTDSTKKEILTKYILVEATDGYKVIFSLAEIDPNISNQLIILADSMDGKQLPLNDGTFKVIVPNDKKPARCIRQVTAIKIYSAK